MVQKCLSIKSVYILMLFLIVSVTLFPGNSFALPLSSRVSCDQGNSHLRQACIDKILSLYDTRTFSSWMRTRNISREEFGEKLAKLDTVQLQSLSSRADKIYAAGDLGGVLVLIAIITLVVIAILYFTDYSVRIEPKHNKE